MIRVEEVTKFHQGRCVLDQISLEIPEGTNLGLIGPGGAGKSVLLKCICGLIRPENGSVFIGDDAVLELDEIELAKLRFRIGMLFQNYALFDFMNVTDNIAFPLRQEGKLSEEEILSRVEDILEEVDLPGIGDRYPNELSGGMKKRVSFARAVIPEPPILFYDDPTAGLDPVTSSKIFKLLENLREERGVTSVTISHDIEGIKEICDHFALLDRGQLVFYGDREAFESTEMTLVRKFWDGFSDDELG